MPSRQVTIRLASQQPLLGIPSYLKELHITKIKLTSA